jgi:hypothetical protein
MQDVKGADSTQEEKQEDQDHEAVMRTAVVEEYKHGNVKHNVRSASRETGVICVCVCEFLFSHE